jgi:outer membrane protein OmpA-like peptidoglycan-associated protein
MRRVVAAAALLTSVLTGAGVSAAQPVAARQPPAAPPLSLENAKPITVPPRPRLQTPALPPAPKPLETPDLMAFPETPNMVAPAAIPAPVNPAGAPPPAAQRRAAPAPAAPVTAQPSAPVTAPPATGAVPLVPPEERVAGAVPKSPAPPLAPPPAAGAVPAALPPLSVDSLSFPAGSSLLPDAVEASLKTLAERMRAQPTSRLQLRAYAMGDVDSERQARQLSLARALAVRERLTALGVRSTRIDVRPLGIAAPPNNPDVRDRVDVEFTSE